MSKFKSALLAAVGLLLLSNALLLTQRGAAHAQTAGLSSGVTLTALAAQVDTLKAEVRTLQAQQAAATPSTSSTTTTTTYGPFTVTGNDVYLTGYNLHIQSGSGTTYGAINGKGNLIIGYDESRGVNQDVRTGSHNLILGTRNNFSGYGGLVAGAQNGITGGYTTITGGYGNRAIGTYSSVSGGQGSTATAAYDLEPASALQTQITALGSTQAAQGKITGLFSLSTDGTRTDGKANTELALTGVNLHLQDGSGYTDDGTGGETSNTTLLGLGNLILGYNKTGNDVGDVRTGSHNLVLGDLNNYSSYGGLVAGYDNAVSGGYSSVSGGRASTASGRFSSIIGGYFNAASGDYAFISGGYGNMASGYQSSVSGGYINTASGSYASVSGGYGDTASSNMASVSGGYQNTASGPFSSVSGGNGNKASGAWASVSGGNGNKASGKYTAISGGSGLLEDNDNGWRAGSLGGTDYSGNFLSP